MKHKKSIFISFCLIASFLISGAISNILNISIEENLNLKTADDSYEENDTFAMAIVVSTPFSSSGLNCSDDDWFRFNIPGNDNSLIVDLLFNHSEGNLDLGLYNSSLQLLQLSNSFDDNESIGYYITTPGDYYINISYYNFANYNYTLNINVLPGNIFENIQIINPAIGINWFNATFNNINWTWTGNIPTVNITLLADDYTPVAPIATNLLNTGGFSWFIPNNIPTGSYRIAVADFIDSTPVGISEIFTITNTGGPIESITVINPNSLSTWFIDTWQTIDWSWTGSITDVSIALWDTSNTIVDFIVASESNDGDYDYWVPNWISPGLYFIEVRDSSGPAGYNTSYFQIINQPPSIQLTSPTESNIWIKYTYQWINWTWTGNINNVGIWIYDCSNSIYEYITSVTNTGSYQFWVSDFLPSGGPLPSGNYYIRINGEPAGVEDTSEIFPIINSGDSQTIYINSPQAGDVWHRNSEYEINWWWSGAITRVNIEVWNDTGSGTVKIRDIAQNIINCGKYMWSIPIIFANGNSYFIKIYDSNNLSTFDDSGLFSIESAGIPGYPVFIVLGVSIISVVSLVYYQTKRKKRIS
ncbi:MAG: Ser-Thr-rich GPI-anchored membrane family protein [Promethearchaeota archaeon]